MSTIIRPKRDSEVEVNTLPDGHIVIFNPHTNLACTLTPVAALVWEFCDGSNTVDEIFQHLSSIDDIPPTPVLKIQELVEELINSGLVYTDE